MVNVLCESGSWVNTLLQAYLASGVFQIYFAFFLNVREKEIVNWIDNLFPFNFQLTIFFRRLVFKISFVQRVPMVISA